MNNDIPQHLAIIMDGNGRWAAKKKMKRIEGHKAGAESVRRVAEFCMEKGISYLTLFSFSTENWSRPKEEIDDLMSLFHRALTRELKTLMKENIRLRSVGEIEKLPFTVRQALHEATKQTKNNSKLNVILAVSYGGRREIVYTARKLAEQVLEGKINPDKIDESLFAKNLWTADIPDPELLIRTSGEFRISNFLLWQIAYSEVVVIPELWPEINGEVMQRCLDDYRKRERRFGGVRSADFK